VTNKYKASPNEVTIKNIQDRPFLTLSTCWPPGTTWQRFIIEAELIQ